MSATENAIKISLPSADFEHQVPMITVPNDYKELVSPQSSHSDFVQNITPFTEVRNSLHGSNDSVNAEKTFEKPPVTLLQLLNVIQKLHKKQTYCT